MGRYFDEMCHNSQPQRLSSWFSTIEKMKHMVGKHDAWRGAMVWPHHALVKIGECFPYVVMRAF